MEAGIIAAIIGAVAAIIAALIGLIGKQPKPKQRVQISDVLVHQTADGICTLDFRVVNHSEFEILINRINLKAIDFESISTLEHKNYSRDYTADLSKLKKKGEAIQIPVSQGINPHGADRFSVLLGASDLAIGEYRYWKLQPVIQVDQEEIIHSDVEVWLPTRLPLSVEEYRKQKAKVAQMTDKSNSYKSKM